MTYQIIARCAYGAMGMCTVAGVWVGVAAFAILALVFDVLADHARGDQ